MKQTLSRSQTPDLDTHCRTLLHQQIFMDSRTLLNILVACLLSVRCLLPLSVSQHIIATFSNV